MISIIGKVPRRNMSRSRFQAERMFEFLRTVLPDDDPVSCIVNPDWSPMGTFKYCQFQDPNVIILVNPDEGMVAGAGCYKASNTNTVVAVYADYYSPDFTTSLYSTSVDYIIGPSLTFKVDLDGGRHHQISGLVPQVVDFIIPYNPAYKPTAVPKEKSKDILVVLDDEPIEIPKVMVDKAIELGTHVVVVGQPNNLLWKNDEEGKVVTCTGEKPLHHLPDVYGSFQYTVPISRTPELLIEPAMCGSVVMALSLNRGLESLLTNVFDTIEDAVNAIGESEEDAHAAAFNDRVSIRMAAAYDIALTTLRRSVFDLGKSTPLSSQIDSWDHQSFVRETLHKLL